VLKRQFFIRLKNSRIPEKKNHTNAIVKSEKCNSILCRAGAQRSRGEIFMPSWGSAFPGGDF
jgi:hypothetical protein